MLSEQDEKVMVMHDGRNYIVQNGVYEVRASQTLSYEGTSFTITSATGGKLDGMSFPAVYIGATSNTTSTDSSLPKQVSEIASVDVSFSSNAGSVEGRFHALNVLWFNTSSRREDALPTAGIVEVWQYVQPEYLAPGTRIASAVTIGAVPGTYDVWDANCLNGLRCIFYLRTQPTANWSGDLRTFLDDALQRANGIEANWYLTRVYAGFDIQTGGVGLAARDVSLVVR
jgi:hypothetical protein